MAARSTVANATSGRIRQRCSAGMTVHDSAIARAHQVMPNARTPKRPSTSRRPLAIPAPIPVARARRRSVRPPTALLEPLDLSMAVPAPGGVHRVKDARRLAEDRCVVHRRMTHKNHHAVGRAKSPDIERHRPEFNVMAVAAEDRGRELYDRYERIVVLDDRALAVEDLHHPDRRGLSGVVDVLLERRP